MAIQPKSLSKESTLSFIGCGVMAESIIAGLLREEIVSPSQIAASHPRDDRRAELETKYGIKVFADNVGAASAFPDAESVVILCVKPQRFSDVLKELAGSIKPEQLVISIVTGAGIETISETLNNHLVVRAMPNTPSQIGAGMTAWTCSPDVDEDHKKQVKIMLSALGKELFVETENMIDMATSLSATGPTYIFMVMEAMPTPACISDFRVKYQKSLSSRQCSALCNSPSNRKNTPPNCEIWSPHRAEPQPKRYIKWKKALCERCCPKRSTAPTHGPSNLANVNDWSARHPCLHRSRDRQTKVYRTTVQRTLVC